MSNLDNSQQRTRQINGIPQSDTLLNYISESPDIGRNLLQQQFAQLNHNALPNGQLQISPFLQLNNPLLGNTQGIFEMPVGSSHNLQPNNPIQNQNPFQQITSQNTLEAEGPNQLLNLLKLPQQNVNVQQMLLNQLLQQQQMNNGQQVPQPAAPLLSSQHLLQVQQQHQQQQQQQQQQAQQQQQIQQQQQQLQQQQQMQQLQQQQQLLQQQNNSHNHLLMQLGLLNNPILIQQLLQAISNPLELQRFQGNLIRIQQQAAQASAALQQIQLPHQMASLGGLPQLPHNLGAVNNIAAPSNTISNPSQNLQQKLINQQKQKEELTNMLEFLVDKMHQTDTDQIFEKKREFKYLQGDDQTIFDNIVHKYQFSKKTKEEMIKYILRKCFKFLKSNIKQQEIVGQKDIEVAFTRKYFGSEMGSQQQLQLQKQFLQSENNIGSRRGNRDSDDSDDQLDERNIKEEQMDNIKEIGSVSNLNSTKNLNVSANNLDQEVMPFKQGSKIKTMNIQFLKLIFKSDLFVKDYQLYLGKLLQFQQFQISFYDLINKEKFEELAQKENQKKIQKCVKNLQDFIDKGQINKVKSYKRLPWLKIWLKETYDLAKTLCAYADEENGKETDILASQNDLKKKIKTQESTSKLPSKVNGEESDQQTPYSPPDFNKTLFQNNQSNRTTSSSLSSASKLKTGAPSSLEGQKQEYNAILKKQQQLEEAQQNQNNGNQQISVSEWKTPDIVRRSPTRADESDLPATDSIKNFEAPKPKKSSEHTQNEIRVIMETASEQGQDVQQPVKNEENENLINSIILKNPQALNSTIV